MDPLSFEGYQTTVDNSFTNVSPSSPDNNENDNNEERDITTDTITVLLFQAAIISKNAKMIEKLLHNSSIMIRINPKQVHHGKRDIMEIYHNLWLDHDTILDNINLNITKADNYYISSLDIIVKLDNERIKRKSVTKYMVKNGKISAIVRTNF